MFKLEKINLYDSLLNIILIYTISTLAYKFSSKIELNNILGVLCIINILLVTIKQLRLRDIFMLIFLFCIDFTAIINSNDMGITVDHVIHITSTILILNLLLNEGTLENLKKAIKRNRKQMKCIIYLSLIITGITLFLPSCYTSNTGEVVYMGISNGSHTVASCLCLVIVILMIYLKDEKFRTTQLVYLAIPILAILKSGSRVYLISIVILIALFCKENMKNYSLKPIMFIVVSTVMVGGFLSSSMFTRFVSTSNNQYISDNSFEAITSGRITWWKYDLDEYGKFKFSKKLFGNGYDCVYDINQRMYGMKIWAHNDFIQLLLSIGILGVIGYLYYILKVHKVIKWNSNKNKYYSFFWMIYILGSACLNGFYTQQHYVFSAVLLACFMMENKKNNLEDEKNATRFSQYNSANV